MNKPPQIHIIIVAVVVILNLIQEYLITASVSGTISQDLVYCPYSGCHLRLMYQLPLLIILAGLFVHFIKQKHEYEIRAAILISVGFLIVNYFLMQLLVWGVDKFAINQLLNNMVLSPLLGVASFYLSYKVVVAVLKTTGFYQEEVF